MKQLLEFIDKHWQELSAGVGTLFSFIFIKGKKVEEVDFKAVAITSIEEKIVTLETNYFELKNKLSLISTTVGSIHELMIKVMEERGEYAITEQFAQIIRDRTDSIKLGFKLKGVLSSVTTTVSEELEKIFIAQYRMGVKNINIDLLEKRIKEKLSIIRLQFSNEHTCEILTEKKFTLAKDILDFEIAKMKSILGNMALYNGSGEKVYKDTVIRFIEDFVVKCVEIFKRD